MTHLSKLVERLSASDIRFMIVGGMAAVIHGSSIVTQDLDVSLSMDSAELEILRECLKDLHPVHRMHPKILTHPESFSGYKNLYLRTDWGILDVVGDLSLVGAFETLYGRAEEFEIFGRKIKVLSLDNLIEIKRKLGREKDLVVVRQLEVIRSQR